MAHILVVDDDLQILQAIAAILGFEGHTTSVARNGRQAVETAQRESLDLILMDIMMPIMDGRAATRILRDDPVTRAIPIILMSGATTIATHALELPADGTLAKPFEIDELLAVVDAQLLRISVAD